MLKITPFLVLHQQNQYVESFLAYLNTCLPAKNPIMNQSIATPKNFILNSKEITLRLETDGSDLRNINYACLAEEDDSILRYYFISAKIKVSEYIYDITFTLDVVNTYQSQITNSANFKNVKVLRQHKDRWIKSDRTYFRVYDKADEGLGELSQDYSSSVNVTTQESYSIIKGWSDLNTNTDEDSSYIISSLPLKNQIVFNSQKTRTIKQYYHTDMSLSWTSSYRGYGFLIYGDSKDTLIHMLISCTGVGARHAIANCIWIGWDDNFNYDIFTMQNLGDGKFKCLTKFKFNSTSDSNHEIKFENIEGTSSFSIQYGMQQTYTSFEPGETVRWNRYVSTPTYDSSKLGTIQVNIDEIDNVNKQDSNIKQIQSMPLVPDSLVYFNGEALINDKVSRESVLVSINDNYKDSLNLYSYGLRERDLESKLFGSYITRRQIVYDTFALPILPEYYANYYSSLQVDVYKPNDMTNDLAIKCLYMKQHNINDNVITCSRNNDLTIYSNEYLEYLRNGYNYDSKNQSLNKLKTSIGIVTGLTGTGIGTYNSVKNASTATSGVLAGQMVGTGVSTIGSLISTGISESQNDIALEEKRRQMLISTPTMSGSSSIELFKKLNEGNLIKYVISKPREAILDSLWNLFYFYGYADNKLYDQMPSLFTRRYFNFIQAEVGVCKITDPIIRNYLIEAYKDGITFCFKYNNEYLFSNYKLYENWERSLKND